MKKALVLLLALCMLLTLCACADSGEKEFEAAKALYDAGDYENAIEALQNVGHYEEITGMIADAQKQLAAESYGFLFATWKSVAWPDDTVEFREDGTYTGTFTAGEGSGSYTVENDCLTVTGVTISEESRITATVPLDITQENGIYCLTIGDMDNAYVREEDFDRFVEEHTVELTLDNYLDYYEWVESRHEEKDDDGNIYSVWIGHTLKPKKAYKGVSSYLSEVEIECTGETHIFQGESLVIDFDTLEYSGASYSDTNTRSETVSLYQDIYMQPVVSYNELYSSDSGYGFITIESPLDIVRVEGHIVIW